MNFDKCIQPWNINDNQHVELSVIPKVSLCQVPVPSYASFLASGNHWYAFSHYRLNSLSKASYKWNHMLHTLLWCLLLFCKIVLRFTHVLSHISSSFLLLTMFYCIDKLQIIHPFTCWWTFELFLAFSYYEWSYSEYLCTSLFVDVSFHLLHLLLRVLSRERNHMVIWTQKVQWENIKIIN